MVPVEGLKVTTLGINMNPGHEGVAVTSWLTLLSSSIDTKLLITFLGIGLTLPTRILRPCLRKVMVEG